MGLVTRDRAIVDDNLASEGPEDKTNEILHYLEQKSTQSSLYLITVGGKTIGFAAIMMGDWDNKTRGRYETRRVFTIIDPEYQTNYTDQVRKELSGLEKELEEALLTEAGCVY